MRASFGPDYSVSGPLSAKGHRMIDNRPDARRIRGAPARRDAAEVPVPDVLRRDGRQEVPPARAARRGPFRLGRVRRRGGRRSTRRRRSPTALPILTTYLLPLVLGKDVASPAGVRRRSRGACAGTGWRRPPSSARSATSSRGPRASRSGRRSAARARRSRSASRSASRRRPRRPSRTCGSTSQQGYRRIKLKIEPGLRRRTVSPPCARRSRTSRSPWTRTRPTRSRDADTLRALDAFGLDYMEQPLHHEDLVGARGAREDAEDADLPRRVDPLGGRRAGRDRARRLPGHQRQDRPRGRARRGRADPRRRARRGRPRLVRRHARGGRRARPQRRDREPSGLLEAGRHVLVLALLRGGHRGAGARGRGRPHAGPGGPGHRASTVRQDVLARVHDGRPGVPRVSARAPRPGRALRGDGAERCSSATSRRSSCARARPTSRRASRSSRVWIAERARGARGSRPRAFRARAAATPSARASATSAAARCSSGTSTRSGPPARSPRSRSASRRASRRGPGVFDMKAGHRRRDRRPRGGRAGGRDARGRRLARPDAGRGGRERRLARPPRRGGAPARPGARPRALGRRRRREDRAQGDRPREGALLRRRVARGPRAGEGRLGAPRDGALRAVRRRARRPPGGHVRRPDRRRVRQGHERRARAGGAHRGLPRLDAGGGGPRHGGPARVPARGSRA